MTGDIYWWKTFTDGKHLMTVYFCRNPGRKIISSASAVVGNVSSHPDYLQNTPKCWNIGNKTNCSWNGDIAGNVICRHAGQKINYPKPLAVVQTASPCTHCIRHCQKFANHQQQKQCPNKCWNCCQKGNLQVCLLEIYLECVGQWFRWFPDTQITFGLAQNGETLTPKVIHK